MGTAGGPSLPGQHPSVLFWFCLFLFLFVRPRFSKPCIALGSCLLSSAHTSPPSPHFLCYPASAMQGPSLPIFPSSTYVAVFSDSLEQR